MARQLLLIRHASIAPRYAGHFLGLDPRHYLLCDVRRAACTTIDLLDGKGVLSGLNEPYVSEGT